jgi:DNA-binding NtrC family response regulator
MSNSGNDQNSPTQRGDRMVALKSEWFDSEYTACDDGADHIEGHAPSVAQRTRRILLAEDDTEMRRYLSEALRKLQYEVVEAKNGRHVLDYIVINRAVGDGLNFDLVISDVRMPGANGLQILSAVRAHDPALPVILITAFGNPELHAEAGLRGARAMIDKPFEFDELLQKVRSALGS